MAEMKWKYEIGNRIIDYKEDGTLKRDLTIIDRKLEVKTINKQNTIGESYNIRKKYYKYHCNICGRDSGWVAESNLFNRKDSCPHRNVRIMEWKYEIEDNIVEYKKDGAIKRNLTIIDKKIETRKHARQSCINGFFLEKIKRYKYHCNICGWDSNWVDENNLCSKKEGCSCCNGKTVAKGINDVATTHPHLVEYFKNKKEAFLYTAHSDHCPELICPNCGHIKTKMSIKTLTNGGFGCNMCSDGISYPEKFVISVLKQLNINFIHQLSSQNCTWCNKYRYDFYIPENKMIIETHGIQHYEDAFCYLGGRNSQEERKNDKLKANLAKKNNIRDYIVLDCRCSELEWMKNSILNSKINEMYDLSNVDWNLCVEFATKSIVKEVCDYWNEHDDLIVNDLAKVFHFISKPTIRKYLKLGTDLGWCNYNPKIESEKQKRKVSVFKDERFLGTFDSISELSRKSQDLLGINCTINGISKVCLHKANHHKGFIFRFADGC